MRSRLLRIGGFLFISLLIRASLAATSGEAVVATSSGELRGVPDGSVTAFRGIPYAKAPVGSLRWRAPAKVNPWRGVRDASGFAASCTQPWPPPLFGPYTAEFVETPAVSEDCLYLNVWTSADRARRKPVLVWIHGGAFLGGSGAIPIYNGRNLASRGIVVVTINYRVGPFGFLALPQLSAESARASSGNYGVLDLIAALQWVHSNIAQFGGDPAAVTIAGQSAGAVAVNDLMACPAAKGLFVRAIAESGSGLGVRASPLEEAEKTGAAFVKRLGTTDLAALRAMPAEQIQGAVELPIGRGSSRPRELPFHPVLDGVVLVADPENPRAPVPGPVPLLTGYNADEALALHEESTPATFEKAVRDRYGSSAERLLALYPHLNGTDANASTGELARDRYMTSLLLWATTRTRASGERIYAYLFDHPVPTPKPPSWGTFHTAEVPYVFGTLDAQIRPYTDADREVAAQMSGYWLNFIERGDPNGPGLPPWPAQAPDSTEVHGLGDQVRARQAVSSPERLAALRDYVESGGRLGLQ